MGPRVTDNTLRGNHGEHVVAQMLSRSCLVRPVVGNTDIGVDLYCESVIEGEPFLHFWAQVKASDDFPNEPKETGFPFKTEHLEYWSKQPVPVVAFLVPTRDAEIRFVHVVDVTLDVLERGVSQGVTQTLKSRTNLGIPVSDPAAAASQIEGLILSHLPMVISAQYAEKGFVYAAPKPKEEYIKYLSLHFIDRYLGRIAENTRLGAAMGILTALDRGRDLSQIPNGLINTLKAFEDDLHFETHEALGRLKQAEGDLEGARQAYERAERMVRNEKNADPSVPPLSETIAKLKARLESLDKIPR